MSTPIPTNRARFTLAEIAEATGGELVGDGTLAIAGVSTDSRSVSGDALFVALVGERFDGHAFVGEAGAAAALLSDPSAAPAGLPHVVVPDTLEALGALAQAHRLRWGGRVVGITGSAGKTTTKELVTAALRASGEKTAATAGNLNNLIGVPMTLLALEDEALAVVEMGTSARGEIEALAAMALPDVGVVTLVDASHTEGLGSVDDVLVEKAALLAVLEPDDVAVLNADDARLRALHVEARRIEYGAGPEADVRVLSFDTSEEGTTVRYAVGDEEYETRLQLLGRGAALAGAAALAVATALGHDIATAAAALSSVAPVEGRARLLQRSDGVLVLDDAYNANPASVRLALETAAALAKKRGGRLHAVLGDMKELGTLTKRLHTAALAHAHAHGATLALVGPAMREAADDDICFDDADAVRLDPGPQDVVLVKGSRSMHLERVVEALMRGEGGA